MKPIENNDAEDLRLNLLTQEIKFARMLAGNTFDGALKEKHIDKLGSWLKNRASCTEGKQFWLSHCHLLFWQYEIDMFAISSMQIINLMILT